MAKLSSHGLEIGRIEYLTYTKAYMSDGHILKNSGSGWKLCAKLKPGVDAKGYYEKKRREVEISRKDHPAYSCYLKSLHKLTSMANRWRLNHAIELLGDDIDGIWSECCDNYGDNVHADVDEIASLVRDYKAAVAEIDEIRKTAAIAAA